ncbi:MAG: hypothetical protein NDI61_14235 [Bdellovibrionaceae bacterium]|nr:hypothetical protein [Pseudobdellovibrionaceae bacterium]
MKLFTGPLLVATLVITIATDANAAKASAKEISDAPEFQRALVLATKDKTKAAHPIVERLLAREKSDIPRDRLLMTKGRLLFQDGDMRGAIRAYEQVPNDSDHWLESLEERAWAHVRLGEHGQALAHLRTIKAPLFQNLIGPEPYFLTGLIHLKVCDYPAIFESIREFQTKFRARLVAMQTLAKTGSSEAARNAIAKLRTQPLIWKTIAPEAGDLPRLFYRDVTFRERAAQFAAGRVDASILERRLQHLAQRDLKEISEILQKMHLLEAEVIQRIHMAERPSTRVNRDIKIAKGQEVLKFPDTGEYWMDELDKYHVTVSGCPTESSVSSAKTAATGGQKR